MFCFGNPAKQTAKWALTRSSNVQQVIVLRLEASSEDSLQRIYNEVEPLLTICDLCKPARISMESVTVAFSFS
jgi:hypothetical protein